MIYYYIICFMISLVILGIYIYLWEDYFNIYITCIEVIVPLVNLGCMWVASSETMEAAILGNRVTYIGGCFLPPLVTFALLEICGFRVRKDYASIALSIASVIYITVICSDFSDMFYKSFSLITKNGVTVLNKEYGFMHTLAYVCIIGYALFNIAVLIYCIAKRRKASIRNIYMILITEIVTILVFFSTSVFDISIEPSAVYIISQAVFLIISVRTHYYDVSENISEIIEEDGSLGYVTFDSRKNFLGSNNAADAWFPELTTLQADHPLDNKDGIKGDFAQWFKRLDDGEKTVYDVMKSGGKSIAVSMDTFMMTKTKKAYRVSMRDDTDHQKLVSILNDEKMKAEKERRRISSTFERYIDPRIVRELMKDEEGVMTVGREHNIAVLFADIRGFTSMSETREPAEVIEILNKCLDVMVDCILQNRGTLDKFIGDCAMAFWTETTSNEEAAYLACKAAMDMKVASRKMTEELEKDYGINMRMGIGVNYGRAIIGNVGTEMRSDYTAIGDTVNVASRLKDVARADEILITDKVAERIEYRSRVVPFEETMRLKGRNANTKVYKLEELSGRS